MDIIVQIAQILFILSVLVILHEFGHYLTARFFGVKAEKFYLFMDAGFSLFKKKIGDTEWGIGWLPIGGYVKLAGMMDESMDSEQLKEPPKSYEFRSKPAWQRMIILLGGIIVNILLAIVIYTVMYSTVGKEYINKDAYQKNGLAFSEVGHSVGFRDGDKIISVDGKNQKRLDWQLIDVLLGDDILVEREGKPMHLHLSEENIRDLLSSDGKNFASPRIPIIIDSISPHSNALRSGLQVEDRVVQIDSVPTSYLDELKAYLDQHKSDSVNVWVERNSVKVPLKTKVSDTATLGIHIQNPNREDFFINQKMPIGNAFASALKDSYEIFIYNIKQFKLILKPKTEAYKQIKSPIGITRQLPTTWDWRFVFNFMAFFSLALAFMNLLPIPGLDGGHALFTGIEMITGKTLSEKAAKNVQTAGMVFLLTLMAFVFGKDIWEIIRDNFFKGGGA